MEQTAFDFSWPEPVENPPAATSEKHRTVHVQPAETMADIHACAAADISLTDGRRRDLLSGLNRFGAIAGRPLTEIPATASAIRAVFAEAKPIRLGIKRKTLQTLRSSVAFAVNQFAPARKTSSSAVKENWNAEWAALIGLIQTPFRRHALSRFAEFCSQQAISPADVMPETLAGFYLALTEAEIVKEPKNIVHGTISSWNRAARDIPSWPQIRLSSPTKPTPYVLPLSAFPQGFQSDLANWEKGVSAKPKAASIFSAEELLRPLRQDTIKSHLLLFRQVATALVKSGTMKLDEIDSLAELCDPDKLKVALEFEYERLGGKERRVLEMASKLRVLAKHFAKLSPDQIAKFDQLCANRPKRQNHITDKNRERLSQFDDPANYALLLSVPARLAKEARQTANAYRAAKLMEQAVAVSILLRVAPRLATLRRLELGWFKRQADSSFVLIIPPGVMKGGRPLELTLNAEFAGLLDEHTERFRSALPGASGSYLFPGESSGPRSKNAMYEQIVDAGREVGLDINPHLFRHLLQKVCVERDPSSVGDVSKVLGHASISTTVIFYADRNGKAASKRLDQLLSNAKDAELPK
ncbi:hypothetical protein ASE66_09235 [Bosea sp. Root483D1]|uniref:site-specific integrase n=1 Tax=Bosea sp. Root483D1 TaxID=1736544 RepID=UPI00070B2F7A|nr:site-specific integrase [Bosea sp. Root483D1]KRE16786.1 hypothetical protein ASE66_09235 [Bosea sp. Root483D1]